MLNHLRLLTVRCCYFVVSLSKGNHNCSVVTSRLIGAATYVWVVKSYEQLCYSDKLCLRDKILNTILKVYLEKICNNSFYEHHTDTDFSIITTDNLNPIEVTVNHVAHIFSSANPERVTLELFGNPIKNTATQAAPFNRSTDQNKG